MIKDNGPQPELENLLNSLLEQSSGRVDKHLERLLANSDMMAYQIAYLMATDETLSEEDKRALYETWEKFAALSGLWTAVYTMDRADTKLVYDPYADGGSSRLDTRKTKITGLNLDGKIGWVKEFTFDGEVTVLFPDGTKKSCNKTSYAASLFPNEDGFTTEKDMLKYQELMKARDKLMRDLLKDTVIGTIGIFVPGVDKMVGLAEGLANKDVFDSLKNGADMKDFNSKGKNYAKDAAINMANFIKNLKENEKELGKVNSDILGDLIGAGGFIIKSGNKGASYQQFSPGVIEAITRLEESGLGGFVTEENEQTPNGYTKKDFEAIEKLLGPEGTLSDTDEKIKQFLLYGGKLSDLDNYSDLVEALKNIGKEQFDGKLTYFEKLFTQYAEKYNK